MPSPPARQIGYVRVSTEQQACTGLSLEAQRAKLEALAVVNDLELVDVVVDAGASAKTLDRPGWQRIMGAVSRREVAAVLIAKLDRATRSVADLADLADLAGLIETFQRRGVALISAAESLDTSSAGGRLVVNVLGAVAQWEREATAERTSAALQVLRLQAAPPAGWRPTVASSSTAAGSTTRASRQRSPIWSNTAAAASHGPRWPTSSTRQGAAPAPEAAGRARAATRQGRNVALIDTDPQQSAARWGDRRAAALPVVLTVPPSRLAAELQRCADAGTDLAIIDTPPRAGSDNAAQVAARVADLVLLPCRPSVLDVEAVADTAARVRAVTAAPVVVLLTACAPRGQDADQVAAALAGVDVQVAPVRIGQRIVLARSLLAGQVAQETEPGGRAAQEVAAVHAFIACTLERREHSNTVRGAA